MFLFNPDGSLLEAELILSGEELRGFIAASYIQWDLNYSRGVYPSTSELFDFGGDNVSSTIFPNKSEPLYVLKYSYLIFVFENNSFLDGLDKYFELIRSDLRREDFDIRFKGRSIMTSSNLPFPILEKMYKSLSAVDIAKSYENGTILLRDDGYWLNRLKKEFPKSKIPDHAYPIEYYIYLSFKDNESRYDSFLYSINSSYDGEARRIPKLNVYHYTYLNKVPIKRDFNLLYIKWLVKSAKLTTRRFLIPYRDVDNLKSLQYLLKKGYELTHQNFTAAVKKGNVDALRFLVDIGIKPKIEDANLALMKGHTDVLLFLETMKVLPNLEPELYPDLEFLKQNMELTEFLRSRDLLLDLVDEYTHTNDLEGLEFLEQLKILPSQAVINLAFENGSWDIQRFLESKNLLPDAEFLDKLVYEGDIYDFIDWVEKGVIPDYKNANIAARQGNFEIVKFLIKIDVLPTEGFELKNFHDNVNILKFLIKNGVPITKRSMKHLVYIGDEESIKFLAEHNILPSQDMVNHMHRHNILFDEEFLAFLESIGLYEDEGEQINESWADIMKFDKLASKNIPRGWEND
jgi:hypothetical protein